MTPSQQTPKIDHGVLTWEGPAEKYEIYANNHLLAAVSERSLDLAETLNYGVGAYQLHIKPIGYNELITYNDVTFTIAALTNDNFISELSNNNGAGIYYVLTEDVSYGFAYVDNSKALYVPVEKFEGATLDGRGYKISVDYTGAGYAVEMLGGLFGETKNALIRNLNFELTASLAGNRVLPSAYSAALIHTAKDGTRVENCYIRSRITATSDIPEEDNANDATKLTSHFGPIVADIPEKNVVVIRNCVIDSAINRIGVVLPNTMTLGGRSIVTPLFMQNNAYIVNGAVKNKYFAKDGIYKLLFYTDSIPAENWLFASFDDFLNGRNGNYCKSENWNCTWETNVNPSGKHGNAKLYKSSAWSGTTFAADAEKIFTLCGKPCYYPETPIGPTQQTPKIDGGVLTWEGFAKKYEIYGNDHLLATVSEKSFDVAKALNYAAGTYQLHIKPVDDNGQITYNDVTFTIATLTNDNFISELSKNNSAIDYYVLTEDVSYAFAYEDNTKALYAPIEKFEGATLDGRGYKVSVDYTGAGYAVEMLGGLFGETKNASIKNLNYELTASLGGNRVLPNAYSAALIHTANDGTQVENCYIRSRITAASDIPEVDNTNDATKLTSHFGPILADIPEGNVVVIRNCVIDSAIYRNGVLLPNTMTLGGKNIVTPLFMQNNAYIVNDAVKDEYFGKDGIYKSLFYTDSILAENWLFASFDDFLNGRNGYYCKSENWNCTWETNVNPIDKHGNAKLYESSAWSETTIAADAEKIFTLCSKPCYYSETVTPPTQQTPIIDRGVLTWEGSAKEYEIYGNDRLLATVSEKSLDLAEALNYAAGTYQLHIKPVGDNGQIVYNDVTFTIVALTQDNFVDKLSNSSADVYYVLTENITVSTEYQADKRTTANGKYDDPIVYASVAEFHGILDGQGYKISVEYGGGAKIDGDWEVFGGLFGYTEDAVIQNVNLDLTAQLNGHVIKVLPGGVIAAVLGSNTTIQNCYINSVINVWNATDAKGIGAIAGKLFGGTSGCVIKNNVVSSKIVLNGVQQDSPDRLIADVNENIQMNGNAYIINRTLPTELGQGELHDEAFMAWGVDAMDNWLFATLSDFVTGGAGHKCTYHGATDWSREWALSQTPSEVLYKSEAWSKTTFDYDETNGFTLCGKKVFAATPEMPELPELQGGMLTWRGSAKNYKLLVNGVEIDEINGNNVQIVYAISDAILHEQLPESTDNTYSVIIKPVDYNWEITYSPVTVKVVALTQNNFVDKLSNSSADTYYVLTENITVSTEYQADKRTTANGKYEEALVYAPVAEFHGILDGQGYKISVEYGGGAKIDGGWEVFGGLFGYTQDAVIQNVSFDLIAQLNGHVIKVLPGGVMVAVLGPNTTIQNCYINSVINVWNATDAKGIGAIAGKLFGGTSGCVIKNNVVSSKIVLNGVQQDSPDRLIADVNENIQMNGNAYIINRTLPTEFGQGKLHDEAFMAWGVDAMDNWLFATLSDFLTGGAGHKCMYHGATDWSREWALSQTPSEALYKSEAWSKTTFDYDETNGFTLCGRPCYYPRAYALQPKRREYLYGGKTSRGYIMTNLFVYLPEIY